MHQLYPFIRRVRRPLIAVDAPVPVVGNVEPVKVEANTTNHGPQTTGPAEAGTTNEGDEPSASTPVE
jgi:hypothetical protein